MRAQGTISAVESSIEEVIRKVSADNDGRIERLARELGAAEEREKRHLQTIANLEFDRENRRERKAAKGYGSRRRKEVA